MTTVELFAGRFVVLLVITGITLATCSAVPLATVFVLTIAVNGPAAGLIEKAIVKAVAVADVTVPTAPLLNATVLLAAVEENPDPLMVIVAALAARLAAAVVTLGLTTATWTAAPLAIEFVVTTAVRLPAAGCVPSVTVNEVAVAEATVPTAPLLKTTELLAATGSKAKP